MTKMQMEMGSKNPMIVHGRRRSRSRRRAMPATPRSAARGRNAPAASRLIVHDAVHDAFVEKLVAAAKDPARGPRARAGHADRAGGLQGAARPETSTTSRRARRKAPSFCAAASGSSGPPRAANKWRPAVFAGTSNAMRINREEMFAPITCIIRAGGYDEALAIANDTPFGLAAGIMTRSLARAGHFRANNARRLRDGEPAHRRDGLSRALRRARRVLLRPARAGPLRRRVLHHRQDGLRRRGERRNDPRANRRAAIRQLVGENLSPDAGGRRSRRPRDDHLSRDVPRDRAEHRALEPLVRAPSGPDLPGFRGRRRADRAGDRAHRDLLRRAEPVLHRGRHRARRDHAPARPALHAADIQ